MITVQRVNPEQWERRSRELAVLPMVLQRVVDRVLTSVVQDAREDLVKAVEGEGSRIALRLRRLSARYAASKGHDRPLIDTRDYITAIRTDTSGGAYTIALPTGMHAGTTLTFALLAAFLENGTRHIEPLPHWRPAANNAVRLLRERIQEEVSRALRVS